MEFSKFWNFLDCFIFAFPILSFSKMTKKILIFHSTKGKKFKTLFFNFAGMADTHTLSARCYFSVKGIGVSKNQNVPVV